MTQGELGRPRRGRPCKLTRELQRQFVINMERGLFLEDACALAGVAPATFHGWVQRGQAGEQPFLDFLESVRAAEARARIAMMEVVRKAILGDPRRARPADPNLALRYLSLRWPKRFQASIDQMIDTAALDNTHRPGMTMAFASAEHRDQVRGLLDAMARGRIVRRDTDDSGETDGQPE